MRICEPAWDSSCDRIATRPRDPFDLAVIEVARRLPAYFRRRLRDVADADDLVQETLLKAYRSRAGLRDITRVKPWLYRIARGTIADYYRRKAPGVEAMENSAGAVTDAERDDAKQIIVCSAQCYLETLAPAYRDPVHLAEYEGLSHGEIAQRLGLSLAAAKSRIRRGKLMVRKLMEARCSFEYDAFGHVVGYQLRAVHGARARTCK